MVKVIGAYVQLLVSNAPKMFALGNMSESLRRPCIKQFANHTVMIRNSVNRFKMCLVNFMTELAPHLFII